MLETINKRLDLAEFGPRVVDDLVALHQLSLRDLFVILDLVPTPILVAMDATATDIRSNAAGRLLFMADPSQNLSQSAEAHERPDFLVYANDVIVPPNELPMQRSAATGESVRGAECELRFGSGAVKYIRGNVDPIVDRFGKVRGSVGVFIDITDVKVLERQNELLTREVEHRARNCLTLVQSLARRALKPKLSADEFESFEARLVALGRSIEISTPISGSVPTVASVLDAALRPLLGELHARVAYAGPPVQLGQQAALSIGLALHELGTNACKYGALSSSAGVVTLSWASSDDRRVVLEWIERDGPPVSAPTRSGFGTKLLSQLMGRNSGYSSEARFDEAGLQYRLTVPNEI